MIKKTYEVYVKIDNQNRIIDINSSAFLTDISNWSQIDEGADGSKYGHAQSGYFDKSLYTADGVPRYKLVDGKAVERTEEEINADKPKPQKPQPTVEQLQEQLLQTQLALTEVYEMMLANNTNAVNKISW